MKYATVCDDVPHILLSFYRLDVSFWLEDGQLRYRAPKGAISAEKLQVLRGKKPEIIAFLAKSRCLPLIEESVTAPSPASGGISIQSGESISSHDFGGNEIRKQQPICWPYWKLLEIRKPWGIIDLEIDFSSRELKFELGRSEPRALSCPRCGRKSPLHDYRTRKYRQRPSKQLLILISASVPRCCCLIHGVQETHIPWLQADARWTEQPGSDRNGVLKRLRTQLRTASRKQVPQSLLASSVRLLRPIADRIRKPLIDGALERIAAGSPSVSLPLDADPPYKAYQCFGAHPLSILGAVGDLTPLLASDYINLACLKNPMYGMMSASIVPHRTIGHLIASGHCELFDVNEKALFRLTNTRRLIQLMIDRISDGWYALLHVNKYYLPAHGAYLTTDFLHDCLVSGFDVEKKSFKVIMYLNTGEYGVADIPFSHMSMALARRGTKLLLEDSVCYLPVAFFVRPKRNLQFQFDRDAGCRNLQDYLQSSPPDYVLYARDAPIYAGDWEMAFGYPEKYGLYGLKAFLGIVSGIKSLTSEGGLIDMKDTRVLWEHKKIMHSNIAFWKAQAHVPNADMLVELYAEVVRWARDLHLMCFAYNHDKNSADIDRHLDKFHGIIEFEKQALTQMLLGITKSSRA